MKTRGIFRDGEFVRCTVDFPVCIGRALAEEHNQDERCTCGEFTTADRNLAFKRRWTAETEYQFASLKKWGHVLTGGCP